MPYVLVTAPNVRVWLKAEVRGRSSVRPLHPRKPTLAAHGKAQPSRPLRALDLTGSGATSCSYAACTNVPTERSNSLDRGRIALAALRELAARLSPLKGRSVRLPTPTCGTKRCCAPLPRSTNRIAPVPLTEIYPVPPGDEWLAMRSASTKLLRHVVMSSRFRPSIMPAQRSRRASRGISRAACKFSATSLVS